MVNLPRRTETRRERRGVGTLPGVTLEVHRRLLVVCLKNDFTLPDLL